MKGDVALRRRPALDLGHQAERRAGSRSGGVRLESRDERDEGRGETHLQVHIELLRAGSWCDFYGTDILLALGVDMFEDDWERCAQGCRHALWRVTKIYGRAFDLG